MPNFLFISRQNSCTVYVPPKYLHISRQNTCIFPTKISVYFSPKYLYTWYIPPKYLSISRQNNATFPAKIHLHFPPIFRPKLLPRGDEVGPVGHGHLGEMELRAGVVAVGGAQERVAQHVRHLLPVQAPLTLHKKGKNRLCVDIWGRLDPV